MSVSQGLHGYAEQLRHDAKFRANLDMPDLRLLSDPATLAC